MLTIYLNKYVSFFCLAFFTIAKEAAEYIRCSKRFPGTQYGNVLHLTVSALLDEIVFDLRNNDIGFLLSGHFIVVVNSDKLLCG